MGGISLIFYDVDLLMLASKSRWVQACFDYLVSIFERVGLQSTPVFVISVTNTNSLLLFQKLKGN